MALFLRADLSQAEDRVVKVLSHDPELVKLANSKPWEFDVHVMNASIVFQKETHDVTKPERQAAKRVVHLSNYDGSPQRASEALLQEGFTISVKECVLGRDRYRKRFPGIVNGYQFRTRMLVINERQLIGWNGFTIRFPYERLDDALFRRAYAWRPQHFVGSLLNQKGVIPAYEFIDKHGLSSRLAFQVHDEIAISVANEREGWDLAQVLRDSLEAEQEYDGEKLAIPAEFALERRYHAARNEDVVEYRRFPTKEQFEDDFRTLSVNINR